MDSNALLADDTFQQCDELLEQMNAMLRSARLGDWPAVLGGQASYIEKMQQLRMPRGGNAETRSALEQRLRTLTTLESELTVQLKARQSQLQEVLGDVGTRRKLARSYGQGNYGQGSYGQNS
ncbi:flagellar protein FliT [Cobetia sp. 1CM21F]|uniref:flagellar protein FliT n=1 Tax=Cobetia sp. 1CM21F TaxID=2929163 RepID=UPI0020C166E9|nr:flagellar protein FliT [Cobetia sp. 1CM21F]MCK8067258.1 flagellar protein FliT [Cobetia sp. 1CM21F]